MSTEHRPHIWFRYGNWHCGIAPVWIGMWPLGIGDTAEQAFNDWERRWKIERGTK